MGLDGVRDPLLGLRDPGRPQDGADLRRARRRPSRAASPGGGGPGGGQAALEKYNAQLLEARTEATRIREGAKEQGALIVAEMRARPRRRPPGSPSRGTGRSRPSVSRRSSSCAARSARCRRPGEQDRRGVARGRGPPEGHRRPLPRRARGRDRRAREGSPAVVGTPDGVGSPPPRRVATRPRDLQAAFDAVPRRAPSRDVSPSWDRRLAEGLFAVTAAVDGNIPLRRALADPSREGPPTSRALSGAALRRQGR